LESWLANAGTWSPRRGDLLVGRAALDAAFGPGSPRFRTFHRERDEVQASVDEELAMGSVVDAGELDNDSVVPWV